MIRNVLLPSKALTYMIFVEIPISVPSLNEEVHDVNGFSLILFLSVLFSACDWQYNYHSNYYDYKKLLYCIYNLCCFV